MVGGPIAVKRPLVLRKTTGSTREKIVRTSHVVTGFVVSQIIVGFALAIR
jgi:hypothetical protein